MITEYQRRALRALIEGEAARGTKQARKRRERQHALFKLFHDRYGCKYSTLPGEKFKEAVILLLKAPLDEEGTCRES